MQAAIGDARAAMQRGDAAAAIRLLVEAWRAVPDERLAEAIEALSERADRAGGPWPLGGETRADREAAWLALAATDDAAARHALLATLAEGIVHVRLEALAHHRDPRIARRLVDVLAGGPRPVEHTSPLYAQLATCGDPRVLARIEEVRTAYVSTRTNRTEQAAAAFVALDEAVRVAYARPATLAPEEAAHVAAIVALAAATAVDPAAATEDALLAAIYAAPADDGPRAIYADWLLERGDPRGEFIAKQLGLVPDPENRLVELVATHRARLAGPLTPHIVDYKTTFERGFVARTALVPGPLPPAMPAWATVTALDGGIPASDAHPMPALREATNLRRGDLETLALLAAPPPIEHLGVEAGDYRPGGGGFDADARAAFDAFALLAIPTLAHLELSTNTTWIANGLGPRECGWAWQAKQLTALTVPAAGAQIAAWVVAATASSSLRRLRIPPSTIDYSFTFTRAALDAPWHLAVAPRHRAMEVHDLGAILTAIEAITNGALGAIALLVHPKTWRLETRRRFARLVADHRIDPAATPTYVPPR